MDCDICREQPANIHIREIIDGEEKALHICNQCAAERNLTEESLKEFSLAEFLCNMAGLNDELKRSSEASEDEAQITCPTCGTTSEKLRESGLLGCPDCYEYFHPLVEEVIREFHRGSVHTGKRPGAAGGKGSRRRPAMKEAVSLQIDVLKRELQDAIAVENYEKAAELRDEIDRLGTVTSS